MQRIVLVVVQDDGFRQAIGAKLQNEGHGVISLKEIRDVMHIIDSSLPSLILLDSHHLQPELLNLCRYLRQKPETAPIPILMLVYSDVEITRLVHSDLHIDDYVLVPSLWEELLACVHTLVRSGKSRSRHKVVHRSCARKKMLHVTDEVIELGDLRIDVAQSCVMRKSQPIELKQPLLFDLLLYLVLHRGKALTRNQLLKHVWGYEQRYDSRTVDVHMRWLRKQLEEDPAHPQLIQTVRGVGYRFQA
jgi:DNA-binding response OmpR family regulator